MTILAGAAGHTTVTHLLAQVSDDVDRVLATFLDGQVERVERFVADPACLEHWLGMVGDVRALLAAGKRLRPTFCRMGWWCAGGASDDGRIATGCAALELLHVFALVHDDVMDASDTRRGLPTLHRRAAAAHGAAGWRGDADGHGRAVAILAGDLLLGWCHELFDSSGLPADSLSAARSAMFAGFHELVVGQYLDMVGQVGGLASAESVFTINRLKSAKYTVELPLHVGALLAGGSPALLERLSAYALPLGEAFQLRDDVLGLFGDPDVTGKPVGDDLRSGKLTLLTALAHQRADREQAMTMRRHFGRADLDDVALRELLDVVVRTGALAAVESRIARLAGRARTAIPAVPAAEDLRLLLRDLAAALVDRGH